MKRIEVVKLQKENIAENPKAELKELMADIVMAYSIPMLERDKRKVIDRLYARKRFLENQLYGL